MEEDTAGEGDDDDLEGYSWQCGTFRFYFIFMFLIIYYYYCFFILLLLNHD